MVGAVFRDHQAASSGLVEAVTVAFQSLYGPEAMSGAAMPKFDAFMSTVVSVSDVYSAGALTGMILMFCKYVCTVDSICLLICCHGMVY